ncbi:MAG: hypothetical protein ACLTU3_02205, partial [Acutalibacteraceae bacterium]
KAKSGFAGDAGYFLLRALTCASSCAFPRKEITLSSMPNGVWRKLKAASPGMLAISYCARLSMTLLAFPSLR